MRIPRQVSEALHMVIGPAAVPYLVLLTLFTRMLFGQQRDIPFHVLPLFDNHQPRTQGLTIVEGTETITIFSPGARDTKYNHGVVVYPFKGMLYAQWQTSALDEDAEDTHVVYSRSADGSTWSTPVALTDSGTSCMTSSGGWWSNGDTLAAFINVWPHTAGALKEGRTEYRLSIDGEHWGPPQTVTGRDGEPIPGIIEQDVHALPGGRLITAFHVRPGLTATPFYTDDPRGTTGWIAGNMPHLPTTDKRTSRELEPSWFRRSDGSLVMVFRDQQSTFRLLASVSRDSGATWTVPKLVAMPDSRAKQCGGNLPGGTAYLVNNPSGTKDRFPLAITLSRDGFSFDRSLLLRSGGSDMQPMRFTGKYKRVGCSYPKSVVWGDYLYVSYATNKEDVELTRIPIKNLLAR